MCGPRYPSLYQVNTRVWLRKTSPIRDSQSSATRSIRLLGATLLWPDLVRGPQELVDEQLVQFYDRLLELLRRPVLRDGRWRLFECTPSWEGNGTHDCFLIFAWHDPRGDFLVVAVNYASNQSQCHVRLPFPDLAGKQWQLQVLFSAGDPARTAAAPDWRPVGPTT